MPSNNRRLIFNTRERLLSTDLNDMTTLLHAKGTDEVAAVLSGDLYKSGVPVAGVVSGLRVSAANPGVDHTVAITPGVAFKNDTPPTSLDSPYLKVETLATSTLDLAAFVDPGNPRWVCIEVAPGDTAELVSARDIFQPPLGTFIPANVDKIRRPEPVFSVNAGVPGPTPAFPPGNPGQIPLAYVYLPAAAASVIATDVVLCRPLFNSTTLTAEFTKDKGGINVLAAGGGTVQFREYTIKFRTQGTISQVPAGTIAVANFPGNPGWRLGESYPVTDEVIYAYLIAPPYPAGYDADVAFNREFLDVSGRIPSNTLSAINGVVMWSNVAPVGSTSTGPHPAGSVSPNDPTWGGGSTPFTSYLGSVTHIQSLAPAGLTQQLTRADQVRILETAKLPEDQDTQTASSVVGQVGSLRNLSPLLNGTVHGVFAIVLPEAFEYKVRVLDNNLLQGQSYTFNMTAAEEPNQNLAGVFVEPVAFGYSNNALDSYAHRYEFDIMAGTAGAITFDHACGIATNAVNLAVVGYRDRILQQR